MESLPYLRSRVIFLLLLLRQPVTEHFVLLYISSSHEELKLHLSEGTSHDQIMTSHDQIMTSHDQLMTSHDQIMTSHGQMTSHEHH